LLLPGLLDLPRQYPLDRLAIDFLFFAKLIKEVFKGTAAGTDCDSQSKTMFCHPLHAHPDARRSSRDNRFSQGLPSFTMERHVEAVNRRQAASVRSASVAWLNWLKGEPGRSRS
jgi:hypothetical protein